MGVVSTTDVVTNPDTTREVARNASVVCSCFPTEFTGLEICLNSLSGSTRICFTDIKIFYYNF